MSLQSRLSSLITAIGGDIKSIQGNVGTLQSNVNTLQTNLGVGGPWLYDSDVSAVASVSIPNLVGDTDYEYEIFLDGILTTGGVARNITVRPNGLTATTYNIYSSSNRALGNVGLGGFDNSGFLLGYTWGADTMIMGRGLLTAKTGRARKWLGNCESSQVSSAANTYLTETGGRWDDTTTGVTSLTVDFGGGTFTGRIRLRRADRLDLLNQKTATAFKVYRNAALNVQDGTPLQFDVAQYDPDGLYKLTAPNQYQFVCPRAGLWEFTSQYAMQGSPGSLDIYYSVRFWKNGNSGTGSSVWFDGPRLPNRGYPLYVAATQYIDLAAGDTVQPYASMGALFTAAPLQVGAGGMPTFFAGHQVRAT